MSQNQYRIENAGSAAPELYLYGPIGAGWMIEGITADRTVKDLNALGKKKEIHVRIDSPGGNVWDGTNIYNALTRNPARIIVHVDALAASIASIIAMSGSEIRMADNALMMIHEPQGGTFGTASELRKQADLIDKARDNLVNIYRNRSQQAEDKVSDWMRAETWFSATEALQAGLITDITTAPALEARWDRETLTRCGFRNLPAWFASARQKPRLEAYRIKAGQVFRLAV
jgi:ATP-dependent Clp protease protease subunit